MEPSEAVPPEVFQLESHPVSPGRSVVVDALIGGSRLVHTVAIQDGNLGAQGLYGAISITSIVSPGAMPDEERRLTSSYPSIRSRSHRCADG